MQSKPVTKKNGAAQRRLPSSQPPGPNWKTSAKQDGVRGQGPSARASGKAPFPGVTAGSGNVSGQETPRRMRNQEYPGGRSDVQPREKGVRY